MKHFKLNIFYTFPVYFNSLERWILYFNHQETLDFPVSPRMMESGRFWRSAVQAAIDQEMLDFYGCLDAMR